MGPPENHRTHHLSRQRDADPQILSGDDKNRKIDQSDGIFAIFVSVYLNNNYSNLRKCDGSL